MNNYTGDHKKMYRGTIQYITLLNLDNAALVSKCNDAVICKKMNKIEFAPYVNSKIHYCD